MSLDLNTFFDKKFKYAVVGASNYEDKYGYKILKVLKEAGFSVTPIHPYAEQICGLKCYPSVLDIPFQIDVVDFVVPVKITNLVLPEIQKAGIQKVWFQPNTFDQSSLEFCEKNKIQYLKDFCLLSSVLKSF